MSAEYNNNSTGASCNYANLGNYNEGYSMNIAPQGKVTSGAYIVPTWSPISYDSLTGEVPSCSGYSGINAAYSGAGGGKCQTTYRTSLCGGGSP
uniref:Uncharacterized protein n=1 Tax=viral metagenome TaxID=1070528 RepID=A0A6C0ELC9_9ZZZZ